MKPRPTPSRKTDEIKNNTTPSGQTKCANKIQGYTTRRKGYDYFNYTATKNGNDKREGTTPTQAVFPRGDHQQFTQRDNFILWGEIPMLWAHALESKIHDLKNHGNICSEKDGCWIWIHGIKRAMSSGQAVMMDLLQQPTQRETPLKGCLQPRRAKEKEILDLAQLYLRVGGANQNPNRLPIEWTLKKPSCLLKMTKMYINTEAVQWEALSHNHSRVNLHWVPVPSSTDCCCHLLSPAPHHGGPVPGEQWTR